MSDFCLIDLTVPNVGYKWAWMFVPKFQLSLRSTNWAGGPYFWRTFDVLYDTTNHGPSSHSFQNMYRFFGNKYAVIKETYLYWVQQSEYKHELQLWFHWQRKYMIVNNQRKCLWTFAHRMNQELPVASCLKRIQKQLILIKSFCAIVFTKVRHESHIRTVPLKRFFCRILYITVRISFLLARVYAKTGTT